MSFFDQLGLQAAVVSDESANQVLGFKKINGGTNAIGVVKSAKWKEASEFSMDHIIVKFQLTNTSFEGQFADLKIHLKDNDPKKRQSSANMFSRLYLLAGLQPPAHIPTDADLAQFVGKLVGIEIAYYCMQSKDDGKWRDGNWINALHNPNGFVPVDGAEEPKDLNALNMPSQTAAPQSAPTAPVAPAAAPKPAGSWG